MMKLRRGSHAVLGLTDDNLLELSEGRVLRVDGSDVGAPGVTLYLMLGGTHEEMRRDLLTAGYALPEDPNDGNDA